MAEIRAFCAYRPAAERVKRVASPPYDVVTTAQARQLASGNPDSFLHVSRPEIDLPDGTDEHSDEVYAKGRANLLDLVERQQLVRDAEAHLYIYAQQMGEHRQVGVVACASADAYLADEIRKHEKTRPDKEDDRTRHIDELGAHDEPVFLTYRAAQGIDEAVAAVTKQQPVYDFRTDDEVHHQLWVVDVEASRAISKRFADNVPLLYVADGHHRSAAAARVHSKHAGEPGDHESFLAVVFPHDQMNILPYNRVVQDTEGRTAEQLLEQLGKVLQIEPCTEPAPAKSGSFGIYLAGKWYRGQAQPGSFDQDDPVARLDCQICQDQILAPIFGITNPRTAANIGFVGGIHGAAELERRVDAGEASLALYLVATTMEQVMQVSDVGKVMPPKSTWFEPKLRSGLFVHAWAF